MICSCLRLSRGKPGDSSSAAQALQLLEKSDVWPGGIASPLLPMGFQKPLLWGSELEGLFRP